MQVRDAIARGDTVGPRMLVAGNIVGWGGPFSVSFSLIRERGLSLFQEQFNDFITQGSGEEWMHMEPEQLRVAVNKYLDLGPDFIKYGGTSHFSDPVMIGFSTRAQEVMKEMGLNPPKETYGTYSIMGKTFDPAKAEAYAKSFAISRLR